MLVTTVKICREYTSSSFLASRETPDTMSYVMAGLGGSCEVSLITPIFTTDELYISH